jgi:hypothetical protein
VACAVLAKHKLIRSSFVVIVFWFSFFGLVNCVQERVSPLLERCHHRPYILVAMIVASDLNAVPRAIPGTGGDGNIFILKDLRLTGAFLENAKRHLLRSGPG